MTEPRTGSPKRIRCLVIQLARLGDTIQSLMALRAAKQLYPQLEICFVARERFAPAAKRVPWIDKVVTLATDALLGPVLDGTKSELEMIPELAKWVSPLIEDEPWDMLVNWSYSEASSYLAALLPARVKLGYSRREDLAFAALDGWSHYLQAIVQGGIDQNIHLTDILTTQILTALQIHAGEPVDAGNSAVTSKAFFSLELGDRNLDWKWRDSSRRWIGIQLGAGTEAKTWAPAEWAKVANYILRRHPECGIALLGGPEDEPHAREFMRNLEMGRDDTAPLISFVGKTDFDLWASVVGQCQWVLAGDTAAIHLASVLGTRVLNVSIGPVRWVETGPYGNGHYVVTSSQACSGCLSGSQKAEAHRCRSDVTPEAVYAAWTYASSEWAHRRQISLETHFSQLGWSTDLANVRIYRAKIRNTEDGGGVHYEPVIQRALRVQEWTAQVMGHLARAWYCGWVPTIGQEIARSSINPTLIQSLRVLDESSQVLEKICTEATRTAQAIFDKSSRLKSEKIMGIAEKQELAELGRKILELDRLIDRLGPTHPALKGFAQMSKVLMHNLQGEQLSDLGRESAESYRQLQQGVLVLRDWIRHTLALAKPVAVHGAKVHSLAAPQKEV